VTLGNKEGREKAYHAEQVALQDAYAREFSYAASTRSWWDILWDGINRMPRPLMALGTVGLFVYAVADPPGFTVAMTALQAVPQEMWVVLGVVITFYFGGRHFEKLRSKAPSLEKVGKVAAAIEAQRKPRGEATGNASLDKYFSETD